ncbi:MAG: ATP-binding cassette domain-containing protein, partial [Peptococcaceae bacterium]|nr:ATP-binding cassette domain-containing protein [Peptococcaceae bacterium]
MISLKNISKYYGDTHALENLSLEVAEGEICVLLGKSGCGKSTTLRLINKIIPATTGEIVIGGKPIDSYPVEKLRSGIGYVVQSIGLFPHMNVEKNISIVPNLLKWDKRKIKARIQELLDLVG